MPARFEDRSKDRDGPPEPSLQYVITVLFSVLAVSFWVLQVVQHDKYEELAENNHQRTLALRAPRGVVFDRDGRVLVENRHSYSISIVREHTKDLNRTVRLLASVLGFDEKAVREIVDRHRREPTYRPIMIVQDATLAQVAAVTARRLDFELPDVVVEQVPTRRYPDAMAAHLFGYVGEVSDAQIAGDDKLKSGDIVGQSGIEKIYNELLMGAGRREARRRQQRRPGNSDARRRAADRRQAAAAHDRLRRAEGHRGRRSSRSASTARPSCSIRTTARCSGFASRPAYDPNAFAAGIDRATWAALNTDRNRPLQRSRDSGPLLARLDLQDGRGAGRARGRHHHARLQGVLSRATPTSTAATSSAGDQQGRTRLGRPAPRDRAVVRRVLLHRRATWSASTRSTSGRRLLGLGVKSGIDLPNEVQGLVPSTEWKREHRCTRSGTPARRSRWRIGQGAGVGDAGVDGRLHGDARQRRHARHAAPAQGGRRWRRVEAVPPPAPQAKRRDRAREACRRSATACGWSSTSRAGPAAPRGSPATTCRARPARRR